MPDTQDSRGPRWWPSNPSLFTDTGVCPACFTPLGSTLCHNCGLDLAVPGAAALLTAGSAVVAAEANRQDLLGRMRAEQSARERALQAEQLRQLAPPPAPSYAPPYAPTLSPPPTQDRSGPWQQPMAPVQPAPPFGAPPVAAPPVRSGPRRSGVQILMLTVGVILVSIMALFFVLLAYLVASLEVRSILTAVASVVVFGVAVILLRRRLQGTAEGITALAIVLFLLDLWIIRANGLFGSREIDVWLYTGLGMGALTGLLVLAERALPLRALSLSAALLAPIATFSLVQGVLAPVDASSRAWAAVAAVALASLAWTRVARAAERTILRVSGLIAAVIGGLCAFGSFPDLAAGATIAFVVLGGIWFLMLVAGATARDAAATDAVTPATRDGWAVFSAIGLGLAASGAGLSLFTRSEVEDAIFWLPAAVTALAAVAVASLTRIPGLATMVPSLRIATLLPLGLAGIASVPALVQAFLESTWGVTTPPFSLSAFGTASSALVPLDGDAPLGLVFVAALGLAAVAVLGLVRGVAWAPTLVGGLGLIAASAAIGQPVASVVCTGALAVVFLASAAMLRPMSLRTALAALFAGAVAVFGTVGLTSAATFPVTAIGAVALLVAARMVVVRAASPQATAWLAPLATGSAAIALLASVRMVPAWFDAVSGTTSPGASPALWMTIVAVVLGAAVPFATGLLARAECAALAAVAVLATAIGLAELVIVGIVVPLITALALTAVAGVLWQGRRRVAGWPERWAAAAITPATALGALGVAWSEFGAEPALGVVLASATVLLAAVALLLFRTTGDRVGTLPARIAWDGALGLWSLVLVAGVDDPALGWLTLVLLAVAALLVASGSGGVIAGHSPRRHVAWLGLPLAVGGLWLGLARADATVVEFYTLPVAGVLLAILALTLLRRPVPGDAPTAGRAALLSAALVVGLAPSAVVAVDAQPVRAVLVLVTAFALVVAGTLVPPLFRGLPAGLILWAAGAAPAIVVGWGRAVLGPDGRIPFEFWSVGGAAVLLTGGILWQLWQRYPAILATAATAASVLVLVLPTVAALLSPGPATSDFEGWRAVLVLVGTCGFVVATSVSDGFAPAVRWVSVGCATLLAGALVLTAAADPAELATVPLAAALLVSGGFRLARDPAGRSWLELGPGLLVLLLPSLAANFGDNDLWRVVALGVVSLVVLGAGLALKLQAPTLIGAVVVVLHGLAQLWPWISGLYGSVPWWLWAGIGGVILIVFAATYESRIRDFRAVARGVSSLR